jgi:hypothetical protein
MGRPPDDNANDDPVGRPDGSDAKRVFVRRIRLSSGNSIASSGDFLGTVNPSLLPPLLRTSIAPPTLRDDFTNETTSLKVA